MSYFTKQITSAVNTFNNLTPLESIVEQATDMVYNSAKIGGNIMLATTGGTAEQMCQQIQAFARPEDVLIGVSVGGNSESVLRCITLAKLQNTSTIAILGKGGGRTKGIADIDIIIDSDISARIKEVQGFLLTFIREVVEKRIEEANSMGDKDKS